MPQGYLKTSVRNDLGVAVAAGRSKAHREERSAGIDERGGFDGGEWRANVGDKAVYGLIEGASKRASSMQLAASHMRGFEIRPVFAVGK